MPGVCSVADCGRARYGFALHATSPLVAAVPLFRNRILQTNLVLWLVVLALVDVVLPIPILALTMIWVVARKPAWFRRLVRDVYGD